MVASFEGDLRDGIEHSNNAGENNQNIERQDAPIQADAIIIAAHGDMVLRIEHESAAGTTSHGFRVSSPALKAHSKYFERLLQVGRFGEGSLVEAQHNELRKRYMSMIEVPSDELPVVSVQDLGRISHVKALDALCIDFLYILHNKDTQTFPPVANLANLAIVADRFDALEPVKSYVRRKKMVRAIDGKTTLKSDTALSEEKVRQRLLVAVLLDYPPWIEKYSARMIIKGWVGKELDLSAALWWDLPSRLEEEMASRRTYVLETIQSLQTHFVRLYTSRERQCKLGYDSSAQCDSYQLGEMIRFFTRVRTIQMQGAIIEDAEPPAPYAGDLYLLLDTLRQVPEYQIDKFHSHCGIRTRLVPLLDLLQECLQHVGVCAECWSERRVEYAWMEAKRPLVWRRQELRLKPMGSNHGQHASLRAMFMASERDWT